MCTPGVAVEGCPKECYPVTLGAELVSRIGITERRKPTYRDSRVTEDHKPLWPGIFKNKKENENARNRLSENV